MRGQQGQALLIVVLVLIVALTVGLAVVSRSVTNISLTRNEEESSKAFSAAEAGIEQALKSSTNIASTQLQNSSTYSVQVTSLSGTDFLLNGGNSVSKNDGADIWLSDYSADPNLIYQNQWGTSAEPGYITVYWGLSSDACTTQPATNTMAALEIIVLSGPKSAPVTTRYAYDPCAARRNSNNLLTPLSANGETIGGKSFANKTATITVVSGLFMRIVPLYSGTPIAVRACTSSNSACSTLPPQGTKVVSTGIAGETQRKIVVYQAYPGIPTEFFPYILFSPTTQ